MTCAEVKSVFPEAQVLIADDPDGRGKGWAIRQKIPEAVGSEIYFIDGDMEINPKELLKLQQGLEIVDICIGSKPLVNLKFRRKILSFCYRKLVNSIFDLKLGDTQTGIKAFRREALQDYKCDGFAFDVEILAKAVRKGLIVGVVPIECCIKRGKGLSTAFKMLCDTFVIWWRLETENLGWALSYETA